MTLLFYTELLTRCDAGSGLRILPKTIITSDRSSKLEINRKKVQREAPGLHLSDLVGGAVLRGGVRVVRVARGAPLQGALTARRNVHH